MGEEMQGQPSVVKSVDELKGLIGQELGVGKWHEVTQAQVDAFAEVTGDHQFIHVDPERARATPFGGTIAHGYLTLSLLPRLTRDREGVRVELGGRMSVNYGLNRVRFPAPVPVGSRIRARTRLLSVEELPEAGGAGGAGGAGAVQITWQHTVEVEGNEKPAMVAETISRVYL